MLGMDQGQRSNAVGFNTSYLPDGEGARHGGGTYTGQATEPTIQDYENFFGPSARDIKTDLQRFKRHGRWHLPDILQGPNPWLTDRIDGLITDATNSPFTTKILPYRYKEEVDGKIKWNVWSFDEGMASRVPYESAARTLTQSKRSFAGYMVRQGMAIVLEHNFMMTPKGRENFKNQLNQLIGSIQYTNDLDVHMALVLAPSYQKTMRERYYTSDKSPAQVCREFADLFGMMQKNVNALDILIEEGKAILRTWGGPMPDFLLCNSKLTFQMTMTPEKTNYITQGIDGVKRLRQGPDLGSYRGLSVVHSRSFAMETGQHPRDVLRRRVRTAEYYRVLPNKNIASREFEFYNEERDTWFTLSFHDLLKCARYVHDGGDSDNASQVDGIYHRLAQAAAGPVKQVGVQLGFDMGHALGARYLVNHTENPVAFGQIVTRIHNQLAAGGNAPVMFMSDPTTVDIRSGQQDVYWYYRGFTDNQGFIIIPPRDNEAWERVVVEQEAAAALVPRELCQTMMGIGALNKRMLESMYMALKGKPLNDPFSLEPSVAAPGSGKWFAAYAFYLEVFKRAGLCTGYVTGVNVGMVATINAFDNLNFRAKPADGWRLDLRSQYLQMVNAVGSVNHPFHLSPTNADLGMGAGVVVQTFSNALLAEQGGPKLGLLVGHRALLTINVLGPLLGKYNVYGKIMTGLQYLSELDLTRTTGGAATAEMMFLPPMYTQSATDLDFSIAFNEKMVVWIQEYLSKFNRVDAHVSDSELLAVAGISTIPMFATTHTHLFHNLYCMNTPNDKGRTLAEMRDKSGGHLSIEMLKFMRDETASLRQIYIRGLVQYPWLKGGRAAQGFLPINGTTGAQTWAGVQQDVFRAIRRRIEKDPWMEYYTAISGAGGDSRELYQMHGPTITLLMAQQALPAASPRITSVVANGDPVNVVVDMNLFFDTSSPYPREGHELQKADLSHVENVELVIVRPNIEHNMLGVIMGLGGESLGNTLWGQTELSVYDDSMHGIWGMSYKYHERAIVFNEKNLIRMWDIAYDGYNGGKDDTYVNWMDDGDESSRNGPSAFKEATLDLSKNYRGPSMMVMAFVHDRSRLDDTGRNAFDQNFRRNWPSPIVFYDTGSRAPETLAVDYDNVQTVDVEEFRVFNNELYSKAYAGYRGMMPEFKTMHQTRKTAGQSSADAETSTDCLAFQGSMRIKEGGVMIQEIQGSGHHGPDYVGIASVRAGKGQKVAGQAPAPYRLV